ncbi:MAG: amino acid adenylation domain-containing protein [Kiritimatiellales bacterium]|nr:amino acid adenylation domain-containing protein [Kiritimatiellota bacterium]MBL7015967.1 amino acid adenylation domain-containing protein [Kiritimatiellales bacterium]
MKFKDEQTLISAVLKQAATMDSATAVSCGAVSLSYTELDQRSQALAEVLRSNGVDRDVPVAICDERSVEFIVAILAVLRAGGAYVPLDPSYPRARLEFMLADCGAQVLLTQSSLRDRAGLAACIIELDAPIAESPKTKWNPPCADDLAYIIYTSGSTGKPKGVLCHHRGALNMLADGQACRPLGPGDRCSWWTPSGVDTSVYEIFSALSTGAELVAIPEEIRSDVPRCIDWLHEERITSVYIPPMMVAELERWVHSHPGRSRLRRLLTGGAPIPERLLINIARAVPELHIINGYGPTEAAVYCTSYQVTGQGDLSRMTPIGKPIDGVEIHLLDPAMQPVADGQKGEIYIGGVQVERGYLHCRQLTATHFLKNGIGKGTLYRSGDRALRLPDGNLMFYGRTDDQVKFLGYRVELGEIESALCRIEGIREAVVVMREDRPGFQRLVAYYTVTEGDPPDSDALRSTLELELPAHMVPALFVRISHLPETPTGKVDREALPVPSKRDVERLRLDEFKPPVTETERRVADVFQSLLNVDRAGVDDHFFLMGGHSLLATQAISRLGNGVSLQAFYEHPTVGGVALLIEAGVEVPPIPVAEPRKTYPVTAPQRTMWMMHHSDRTGTLANIPEVIHLTGPLNIEVMERALNEVIRRHDALRMVFLMEEGELVQRPLDEVRLEIPVVDLSETGLAERDRRVLEIQRSNGAYRFDLSTGPLMHAELVKLSDDRFDLYLNAHHIAIDGWGLSLLNKEFAAVYEACLEDKPSPLSPPALQYRDVAVWMERQQQSGALKPQLEYWREKLAAPRPDLHFKLDHERPDVSAHKAARHAFNILPELTRELTALGHHENATLYMVLAAIWQTLLHRASGSSDIVTGTAIAGRTRAGMEQVIGTFINALALRTDFSGVTSFQDVIGRVRRTALEAYAHQEIPFATVMEAVDDGTRHPIFRNSLILHNIPLPPKKFAGLTLTDDEIGNDTAKMDMILYFIEREGQLEGQLEYDTELFSAESMDQLAGDFLMLARQVVKEVARPLDDTLFGDAEEVLSCFVIGEGSLCLRCIDVLRRSGMRVLGLISPDAANRRWARKKGIPWHHPDEGFAQVLSARPFDYLFSVVNSHIMKPDVLALPRRAAINYHDAPLPRYAGVYSTAWALINREKTHGITWHLMVDEVDAGDILKQKKVDISGQDTSFTLNARCYDAAVDTLVELASELVEGREVRRQQDLDRRTYYPLNKRPVHGALIDWNAPAKEIDALRRALDFGTQPNDLGLPKVYFGGELYVLLSSGQMCSVDGDPCGLRFPALGEPSGWMVNEPDSEDLGRRLQFQIEKMAPHERFWVRQLELFQPLKLPDIKGGSTKRFALEDIPLFLCFLARFCSQDVLGVGWKIEVDVPEFFASVVPLCLTVDLEKPLYENLQTAAFALNRCRKRKTYARDLFMRFPSLRVRPVYSITLAEGEVACSPQLWEHFKAFRHSADATVPLGSQSVLTDKDRRVLEKFQHQTSGFNDSRCIHQLFEEQAWKTPPAVAVEAVDGKLTYAELNRRADSLAAHLQEQGVGPDMPIGLFVNRSLEMCIGILGILKAGGAYVPLDPDYPDDMVEFIIGDTAMPMVVTVSTLKNRLKQTTCRILCIDQVPDRSDAPVVTAMAADLAYVFYTSGSTGKPKGVMVEHRSVVNHCRASLDVYGITGKDRVLQFFSMSFDGSVEELFPAWACGATVVLRTNEISNSISEFEAFILEQKITVVDLPTAYWHEWVRNLRAVPKTLRAIIIGGEKVSTELCRVWVQKKKGKVRLFNTYGPTECSVVASVHELTTPVSGDVPIGLPIADTALVVADLRGQRVPVGMPGELLIGGAGVARGYLNRPTLTAEKFIPNPWGEGRLYRTGDLVSRQPDGDIVFLGRVDNQVKIRGFRIEPDEIGAVLEQYADISQAIVMARSDLSEQKELVAYYIPEPGYSPSVKELRVFLSANLPEYMVPSAFMELDEFPVASGGKVNRNALPSPVKTSARERENFVPPGTPAEKVMAEIWSVVLGMDEIGIHDNFFDLGGHSLLAIQLVERVLASGASLTVAQLFQSPTIAEMTQIIDMRGEGEYKSLVCLKKGTPGRVPFFLLHSAPGDLLGYSNLVHNLPAEQPVYGFQSLGLIDPENVHSTIPEMAAYYVSVLREFLPDGPYLLGGWCYGGYVALEMSRQLKEQGCEVQLLALIDAWAYPPAERRLAFYWRRLQLMRVVGFQDWVSIMKEKIKNLFHDKAADVTTMLDGVQTTEGVLANREEVYRRNREAALKYSPRYYPGCVTLFRSDDIAAWFLPDMTMEWATTTDDQDIYLVPGPHRGMLHEPAVQVLSARLSKTIEEALS